MSFWTTYNYDPNYGALIFDVTPLSYTFSNTGNKYHIIFRRDYFPGPAGTSVQAPAIYIIDQNSQTMTAYAFINYGIYSFGAQLNKILEIGVNVFLVFGIDSTNSSILKIYPVKLNLGVATIYTWQNINCSGTIGTSRYCV